MKIRFGLGLVFQRPIGGDRVFYSFSTPGVFWITASWQGRSHKDDSLILGRVDLGVFAYRKGDVASSSPGLLSPNPASRILSRQIALWPESRTPLRQRELRVGYGTPDQPLVAFHSSASSLIARHWSSAGPALPWLDVPRPFGIDRVAPRAKRRNVSTRKERLRRFFLPRGERPRDSLRI